MYDNETPEEKAAREREQDLEDAQPSPDDDIFAALSKWLVRNSGVTKKVGLLCAIALGMKSLGIGPSFSDDTKDLSAQRHDYGLTSADGAEMNPMDTEYPEEYIRRLMGDDSKATIKEVQNELLRTIVAAFHVATPPRWKEYGLLLEIKTDKIDTQSMSVVVKYRTIRERQKSSKWMIFGEPLKIKLSGLTPADLKQELTVALKRDTYYAITAEIDRVDGGEYWIHQYWINLSDWGQELQAIREAFGSVDRLVGTVVSVKISPDEFESQSTSVIVEYINNRDKTVESWSESAKLSFKDITPNVESEELEKALGYPFNVIKKEPSRRDGSTTTYWISLNLTEELRTIREAFDSQNRIPGSKVTVNIQRNRLEEVDSTSVIVEYYTHDTEDQGKWDQFATFSFEGIAPAVVSQELKEVLENRHFAIGFEIIGKTEDGVSTTYEVEEYDLTTKLVVLDIVHSPIDI